MTRLLRSGLAVVAAAAAFSCASARARDEDLPPALEGVGITERLDAQVPLSAAFTDSAGHPVELGRYFRGDRPVVMALVYYDCPMLCGLVLGGVGRAMRQSGLELGRDYAAVAISFDPREKPPLAAVRQGGYLQALGRPGAREEWPFLTGTTPEIHAVTEAVGFRYNYDPNTRTYAHAAAIFVLTSKGRVSRYLYGVEFPARDLRLALVEAGRGKVGTSFDRFLLTCYRYDPAARRYVPYALGFVRAGAVAVLAGLATMLGVFWRREAKRRRP